MKFLIDECLHTSLVTVAHETGHVCDHVNFLSLGGCASGTISSSAAVRGTW